MKFYKQFRDEYIDAVTQLNEFIQKNPTFDVVVLSHTVVRYEQLNEDRTYIFTLVEVEE